MADLLACYRSFCRVVERGGLTRAALDLDLAQASVSRHLQELERRYGAPLLARTTRSVRITPAGQRVYDYASAVLRSEDELAASLRERARALTGALTVAGPAGFGHVVLNPFAIAFGKRHGGLQLRLRLAERPVNLVEEGIDLAVRIGEPSDSSLVRRPLGNLREVLVVHPSLLPGRRKPAAPRELAVMPRVGLEGMRAPVLSRGAARHALGERPVYEVDSSLALRDALLGGLGYGAVHEYLVRQALDEGTLVELLPGWALPTWPIGVYFARRDRAARVDRFTDELHAHLQTAGFA
ncbi:HTH-type transcriptional regulator DmlR [Burkholderiales bacterium]|nr:HTH-type transcriptional regulator DmlR [Burkholderiales bacterium]